MFQDLIKTLIMKKLLILIGCGMLFACSEPLDLSKNAQGVTADNVTTQGIGPAPAPSYAWRSMRLPFLPGPPDNIYITNDPEEPKKTIFANGNAYWFVGSLYEYPYKLNKATKRWETFTGPEHISNPFFGGYSYLFNHDTKYYVGWRFVNDDQYGDNRTIYAHDVVTGDTEALPDFPGTLTDESAFVVVGDRGYIMGGRKGNVISNQFWEINLITKVWKNKGGLPAGVRAGAVAYAIGDKLYFGLGYDLIYGNGQWVKIYKDDWYSMTPSGNVNVAAERADFPGRKRGRADGFVIKNKIYVGWGKTSSGEYLNDFWEYNTSNNTWTQRADCPADQLGPDNMKAFSIGETGYFIRGCLGEFWQYSDSPIVIGQAGG
jgi:hypothetical protein